MAKPRVKAPKKAKKGEIVTIKTLIKHKMESGRRKGKDGKTIPRKIINKFTAKMNGETVFSMDIAPSVSANPFIQFNMRAEKTGELLMEWTDDDGSVYSAKKTITVE